MSIGEHRAQAHRIRLIGYRSVPQIVYVVSMSVGLHGTYILVGCPDRSHGIFSCGYATVFLLYLLESVQFAIGILIVQSLYLQNHQSVQSDICQLGVEDALRTKY